MEKIHRTLLLIIISLFCLGEMVGQDYSDFLSLVKSLESKYQVKISYDAELGKDQQLYSAVQGNDSDDINIKLESLFTNHYIAYKIIDGNKILLRRESVKSEFSTISGQIWDSSLNEPLAFASIYVPGTTTGTISDINGRFKLNANDADTLTVQFLGYEEGTIDCQNFSGRIELKPKPVSLEEITIYIHPRTMDKPGNDYIVYDAKQWVEKTSGEVFGKDIIRSLQLLPGIAADNDEGGKLRIRGSESDEVLMLMDGIPLYKMDHYYGIFGAINPFFVDDLSLYKNNQPLEHETRTGGILILNSQQDIKEINGQAEADLMKINGSINIPLGNIGISMGGRWNHTDPFETILADNADNIDLEKAFIDKENFKRAKITEAIPVYDFYDFNGKINWQINNKTNVQFSGISVRDKYQRNYANEFRLFINRKVTQNTEEFIEYETWNNDGLSFELEHQLSQNTKIIGRLYNASYENYNQVDANIFLRNIEKVFVNRKYQSINENRLASTGFDLLLENNLDFSLGFKYIKRENQLSIRENNQRLLNRDQKVNEYSAFASKTINLNSSTTLDLGGKFNYVENFDLASFSPSISMTSRLEAVTLKASYARLYQNTRELQMETRLGVNQQYFVLADNDLYPQGVAHNYMLGLGWSKQFWGVDIEAYYKHLDGAIGYLPVKPGITTNNFVPDVSSLFGVFSGEMNSRGIDVLVYYDQKYWYSQLAYTLSKSENKFKEIYSGNAFPAQYDRRHQLKWFNNFKLSKNFTLGNTLVYTSGRPFLSFDNILDASDRKNIKVEDAIQNLPDYLRLDLSATYQFNLGKASPYLSASIYNVTNNENVKYIQQTFRIRSDAKNNNVVLGFESPLLERLYNLSFGIKF